MVEVDEVRVFHITEIANLPSVLAAGGLLSDRALEGYPHQTIGYGHIKRRRMNEIRVNCCESAFVGDFVPFYYCPRSVMLFVINQGRTGKPAGCQRDIVHLVSSVGILAGLGRDYAVSDGNAGSSSALFSSDLASIRSLDWGAIRSTSWQGQTNRKQAEFLVRDFVPWTEIRYIGCFDQHACDRTVAAIASAEHRPQVSVRSEWYY